MSREGRIGTMTWVDCKFCAHKLRGGECATLFVHTLREMLDANRVDVVCRFFREIPRNEPKIESRKEAWVESRHPDGFARITLDVCPRCNLYVDESIVCDSGLCPRCDEEDEQYQTDQEIERRIDERLMKEHEELT